MTENQKETIFTMVCNDIGRRNLPPGEREYISGLIDAADREIAREGIAANYADVSDIHLCAMYAAYLYSKRRADGQNAGMPRMLRYALNQRLLG